MDYLYYIITTLLPFYDIVKLKDIQNIHMWYDIQ